jgi:hypothetical protein
MMGGKQTISMFNVCEDSLLATPLIIDLAILCELFTRVTYATGGDGEHQGLYSIISLLSYMLKAPLVKVGSRSRLLEVSQEVDSPELTSLTAWPVSVVSIGSARVAETNRFLDALQQTLRALIGLQPTNEVRSMLLLPTWLTLVADQHG